MHGMARSSFHSAGRLSAQRLIVKRSIRYREVMATTPNIEPPAAPAVGSAWLAGLPGQPRPIDAGMLALVALPTSPFWSRRYTRSFLDTCRGMSQETAETAELLVSELVTNSVRFSGDPARRYQYSERGDAGLISLYLRHFPEGLLIEVYDTDNEPPIQSQPSEYAETGRGLMLVNALSKEWSYFFPPGGGKVVYCLLEIP
jgi:anti-sigma regulatory factor (Ser/Thr protein kinase)